MEIEEKLDAIMLFLKQHHESDVSRMVGMMDDNVNWIALKGKVSANHNRDFSILLEKLQADSYLRKGNAPYVLTVDGLLFINKGGYTNQKINQLQTSESLKMMNERAERNERRLVLWTKVLAFGSIALVIVEIWIHWCTMSKILSICRQLSASPQQYC